MTRTRILYYHVLRNTTADILAVLPRTIAVWITSLVVAEVMSNIFGLGGYSLNTSISKVTSLPVTCSIFATLALLVHGILALLRGKFLIKHEGGSLSNRSQAYSAKDRRNYRIALILVLVLGFVTVFGSFLMPHGITETYQIPFKKELVNGALKYQPGPYPPDASFWFGTDHRGYDVISLLLNGAKYTLGFALAVTVLRFLIAVPMGLLVGLTGKGSRFVSLMQMSTSAVPTLIFIFPMFYGLSYLTRSAPGSANNWLFLVLLLVLLIVFGIFQLAQQFSERANYYSGSLFVLASRTMGAPKRQIIFRHLFPLLRAEILFSCIVEYVQVLFLMGQLAVLTIFIGGGESYPVGSGFVLPLTTTGEWGGMIAYGVRELQYFPWIILATGGFFTCAIWILMFFSTQLQKRLTQPALIRTKPAICDKRVWVALGAVVMAAILAVNLRSVKTPITNPKSTTAKPAINPDQVQNRDKEIKKNVQAFMGYLAEDKWDSAYAYVQSDGLKSKTIAPFDHWVTALSKQGYKFVAVKKITHIGKTGDELYKVDLDVTDASGKHVDWSLSMYPLLGIVSGKGE